MQRFHLRKIVELTLLETATAHDVCGLLEA
jgi:hypothetical protein